MTVPFACFVLRVRRFFLDAVVHGRESECEGELSHFAAVFGAFVDLVTNATRLAEHALLVSGF
jgi:hypothetical protein